MPIDIRVVGITGHVSSADTLILTTIETSPQVAVGGGVRRIMWMDGIFLGPGFLNGF